MRNIQFLCNQNLLFSSRDVSQQRWPISCLPFVQRGNDDRVHSDEWLLSATISTPICSSLPLPSSPSVTKYIFCYVIAMIDYFFALSHVKLLLMMLEFGVHPLLVIKLTLFPRHFMLLLVMFHGQANFLIYVSSLLSLLLLPLLLSLSESEPYVEIESDDKALVSIL